MPPESASVLPETTLLFPAPNQVKLTAELFTAACTAWPTQESRARQTVSPPEQHYADLCFAALSPGYLTHATESAAYFGAGTAVFVTLFVLLIFKRFIQPILRWTFKRRAPKQQNGWLPLSRYTRTPKSQ